MNGFICCCPQRKEVRSGRIRRRRRRLKKQLVNGRSHIYTQGHVDLENECPFKSDLAQERRGRKGAEGKAGYLPITVVVFPNLSDQAPSVLTSDMWIHTYIPVDLHNCIHNKYIHVFVANNSPTVPTTDRLQEVEVRGRAWTSVDGVCTEETNATKHKTIVVVHSFVVNIWL
jgi:hypothetical protein